MSRSQAENQSRTLSPPSRQAETACPARVRKRCKMANRSASSSKSLMESRFSSFIVASPPSHLFPQKVSGFSPKKTDGDLAFPGLYLRRTEDLLSHFCCAFRV